MMISILILRWVTILFTLLYIQIIVWSQEDETRDVNRAIPVLCYHRFAENIDTTRGRLTESYSRFEVFLKFLSHNGYSSILPDEIQDENVYKKNVVVFTFDDGVKSQMKAAKLMEEYGFRGIFFIVPKWIEHRDGDFLDDEDIMILQQAGHRIAPHGFAHKSMVAEDEEIYSSLTKSIEILQNILGKYYSIRDFAFPYGHYDYEIAGKLYPTYKYLHTVNPGYWDGESKLIPRMLITSDNTLDFYKEYILSANEFNPLINLITTDGIITNLVEFEMPSGKQIDGIELFTVSPDAEGRIYRSYPIGDNLSWKEGIITVDLKSHINSYYSPERKVLSYALIIRQNSIVHYLTNGHLHWIVD